MARPRRPFSGQETITNGPDRFLVRTASDVLGVRQRARWESSTHWRHRTPNGVLDPLTYLFVLDAVANIDPNIELRAKNLVEWLNLTQNQFIWDPVTVGKVLADLKDGFEGVLGAKNGILEAGTDYRGNFYLLHHNLATANLYFKVREDLMRLAQAEMEARDLGQRSKLLASPLLECPSLRGEFPGAE